MDISADGMERLAKREGVILGAYNDSQGHCTSCIGKLLHYGPCTQADYDEWRGVSRSRCFEEFRKDIKRYVAAVNAALKVPVTQKQFDALVSITYNIGTEGMRTSTFIKKINAREHPRRIIEAIMMWNKPPEIKGRRRSEVDQFLEGSGTPGPPPPLPDPLQLQGRTMMVWS